MFPWVLAACFGVILNKFLRLISGRDTLDFKCGWGCFPGFPAAVFLVGATEPWEEKRVLREGSKLAEKVSAVEMRKCIAGNVLITGAKLVGKGQRPFLFWGESTRNQQQVPNSLFPE